MASQPFNLFYPAAPAQPSSALTDFDIQASQLARKRRLLQLLQDQATKGVAGVTSPSGRLSWANVLAAVVPGAMGAVQSEDLDKQEQELQQQQAAGLEEHLKQFPQGKPEEPMGPPTPEGEYGVSPAQPATAAEMIPWALNAGRFGRQGQDIQKEMLPIALKAMLGKGATAGTGKFQTVFDEKTGRERKAMVDDQGNILSFVGGEKSPEKSGFQKNVEYLMSRGMSEKEAIQYANKDIQYMPTQEGVFPTNRSQLFPFFGGAPGAPGGGGGTPILGGGAPPMLPGAPTPAGAQAAPLAPEPRVLTGPYAKPQVTGPGIGQNLTPTNVRGERELAADVEKYSKRLTDTGIGKMDAAIRMVEDMLAGYKEKGAKNIPGVGLLENTLLGKASKEGADVQNIIRQLRGTKVRSEAGLSQTAAEINNVLQELALGPFDREEIFKNAIPRLRKLLNQFKVEEMAGFDPQVLKEYETRKKKLEGGKAEDDWAKGY